MDERISSSRMDTLVACNLYHITGDQAIPNYRYCRSDAPIYDWNGYSRQWCKRPRTGGQMAPIVEAVAQSV